MIEQSIYIRDLQNKTEFEIYIVHTFGKMSCKVENCQNAFSSVPFNEK